MSDAPKQTIEAMHQLPIERQEEIATIIRHAMDAKPLKLNAVQLRAIDEGVADADANRFASGEEIDAFLAKYRSK